MTLQTLCTAISETAYAQKVINCSGAGADIYTFFANTIKDYPALFITPTGYQRVEENVTHYNLVIYYIERLLTDSSNEMDILSVSIEQLKNLVILIRDIDGVVAVNTEYNITPFTETEALQDRCAGSYATIEVTCVNETICGIV